MARATDPLAPHIAEQIARAQDMLDRLGRRDAYEPNYTGEKLADAMRACARALGMLGDLPDDVAERTRAAAELGFTQGTHLRS